MVRVTALSENRFSTPTNTAYEATSVAAKHGSSSVHPVFELQDERRLL